MGEPAVIAADARAGSVRPTRAAVRISQPTSASAIEEPAPSASVPLRTGRSRLGPVELQVEIRSDGAVANVSTTVHNHSDRDIALDSLILGFRWTEHGCASFRFLRHGWQSWSFTGARDLDESGEPAAPSGPWLRGLHHAAPSFPRDRRGTV